MDFFFAIAAGLAVGSAATWIFLRHEMRSAFERGKALAEGAQATLVERLAARLAPGHCGSGQCFDAGELTF